MADIKLISTWKVFTIEMRKRFMSKKNSGFSGWDRQGYFNSMLLRMQKKANEIDSPHLDDEEKAKNLVDIANFAMFLHQQLTSK